MIKVSRTFLLFYFLAIEVKKDFRILRKLSENAHLLRYPHPSSLRRTSMYASFLGISSRSNACGMDIFRQLLRGEFFDSLGAIGAKGNFFVCATKGCKMILDQFRLDGKVALVTGSGRGLGRAMALALAEAGADLVVTARTRKEIEETASHVKALGKRAISMVCDVTKRSSVNRVVDRAVTKLERLDILVNNAGVAIVKPFLKFDLKEWHVTMDTNLTSMFLFCQAVGPIMMKQGGGKIINLTSVLGAKGRPGMVPYAASKGGVIAFTRNLAVEWAPYHIRVNAIGPGAFYTQPMKVVLDDPKLGPIRRKKIPLKRHGQPDELGPLVVYLASDASDYMTGEVIYVDGGELAKL